MDVIDALDQSYQHTQRVIAGVGAGDYDRPTPCESWTVRDLLEHMVGVVAGLGAAAAGAERQPFTLSDDPATQFETVAATNLAAWRRPGVLDEVVNGGPGPMPGRVLAGINLLDTTTHTWDLARATGQDERLPDDVARAALEASRQIITPEIRSGRFGPELAAPANANATDELVSFLGRPAS